MFLLDNKETDFTIDDIGRRNKIAKLLEEWGLLTIVAPFDKTTPLADMSEIKVVKANEKDQYDLTVKYSIGKHRSGR